MDVYSTSMVVATGRCKADPSAGWVMGRGTAVSCMHECEAVNDGHAVQRCLALVVDHQGSHDCEQHAWLVEGVVPVMHRAGKNHRVALAQ